VPPPCAGRCQTLMDDRTPHRDSKLFRAERPVESLDAAPREQEFGALFQEHSAGLLRYALRLTRKSRDAEDLVQETALSAFEHFDSVKDRTRCRAWFFQILTNRWRSKQRRFFRREFRDLPLEDALGEVDGTAEETNSEDRRIESIDHRRVLEGLGRLVPEMQQVLWLADVEGFALREIAEMTGCALGTAASRLARGRASLRRVLRELDPELFSDKGSSR